MAQKLPSIDSVTTINEDGSRFFVHPADVRGWFTFLRRVAGILLVAVYVLLPWIPINGHPAVFLDVGKSQFHLFGLTFVAQDMWLAFFLITGLGFTLFFLTALFGRLWCGWACPQTVFLDHVFRRVERWIEGDAQKRRQLDEAPWTGGKVFKRVLKHAVFAVLSLAITHIFISYFVSLPGLYAMVRHSPLENWGVFLFVFILGGILYGNFAWFREQFCIVLCPYGRLQSALIDDDSIVIGYDGKRGEPRGKAGDPAHGDCIDCRRCVQVCPTAIDIRQGLQMECIACSNCIDACDEIMVRLGRPKGLVRYDSLNGLAGRGHRILRPRIFVYTVLLLAGFAVMSFAVSTRLKPVVVSAVRMAGAPYYLDAGAIRNNYMLRIVNKQHEPKTFTVAVKSPNASLGVSGVDEGLAVAGESEIQRPLILVLPEADYRGPFAIEVTVRDATGKINVSGAGEFLGPDTGGGE